MCTGTWFQIKILKKADMFGVLLEDEVEQNLHETVARARFHIIMIKHVTFGAALDLCGRVRTAKCAGDCSIYKN